MKSAISALALATLVAIASLTQAHAQTRTARVNVPFAFNFGSQHYDAGVYRIAVNSPSNLAISDAAKRSTRLTMIESRADSGSSNEPASLTFRKYGNTYFLAEYSTSGATFNLVESNKERSLSREYAMSQMGSSLVQVAALEREK